MMILPTPEQLIAYLEAHGWQRSGKLTTAPCHFYVRPLEWKGVEVMVPLRPDYADYERRIHDAVQNISRSEGRCPLPHGACEVWAEMTATPPSWLAEKLRGGYDH